MLNENLKQDENINFSKEGQNSDISKDINQSSESKKNLNTGVKQGKNIILKTKCECAVRSTGLSQERFYRKVEISRQSWYAYSWGIEKFPSYLKIKLCDLFGKPFRDLFLGEEK